MRRETIVISIFTIIIISILFGAVLAENMIYSVCKEHDAYELWNEKVILCEAIK